MSVKTSIPEYLWNDLVLSKIGGIGHWHLVHLGDLCRF